MTPNLKLNIITTIKKEQLKIIDILENRYASKSNFIDYEDELNQADSDVKELLEQIEEKSHYFTKVVNSEDEMLNLFKDFFEKINPYINKITIKYKNYKKDEVAESKIFQHHITVLIIQDILNHYINFLVKLESAILGLYDKQVVLNINVNEQIEIIEFVQNNTNQSIFMPLLLSFGAGYLVGDL
ncbi:MAG: hypothetical protein Q9M32_01530 [Sulfurimonas sp.]|nr:hypothetical protein [Sulfurimonas sp.]